MTRTIHPKRPSSPPSLPSPPNPPDDDFHQRLLQFATDSTFGLRLQSKGSGEEFLKLFKAEHRKYMKGMKKGDIEKFLERRENSFGR